MKVSQSLILIAVFSILCGGFCVASEETENSRITFPQASVGSVELSPYRDAMLHNLHTGGVTFSHDASLKLSDLPTLDFENYSYPRSSNWVVSTHDIWSQNEFINQEKESSTAELQLSSDIVTSFDTGHIIHPKFKFSVGLISSNTIIDSVSVMPLLGIDWDITDRLNLKTANGAFLSYSLGEERSTLLDISLQYHDPAFAIENMQGTVFLKMDDQLLSETSSIIGTVGVKHQWKDVFSIRAFAEIVGESDVIYRATEDEEAEIIQPANILSFGVEGGIRF